MSGRRTLHDSADGDADDFDDYPATHLDEEDYEAFLERELDSRGGLRGAPRVGLIILVLIVILFGVAVVAFR